MGVSGPTLTPSELQKQGYSRKISSLEAFVLFLLGAASLGMGQMAGKLHGQWGVELKPSWDQQWWWQQGLVVQEVMGGRQKHHNISVLTWSCKATESKTREISEIQGA